MTGERTEERLKAAYLRYERLSGSGAARPGTPAAVELAAARVDLVLLLTALGEELPEIVAQQCETDAGLLAKIASL